MKERNKSRKYNVPDIRFFFGMLLLMACLIGGSKFICVQAENEETADIYYEGNVTGRVNIRIGAGETNERLVVNGRNVQLAPGDKVVILNEVMVKSKPWYYIRFELDGEEQLGYCTSTYVQKTDVEITPTLLPTPTPTITPSPTPAPPPTLSVTEAPEATQTPDKETDKDVNDGIVTGIIIAVILAVGVIAFLIIRRVSGNSEKNEMTKALKGLQNVKISQEPKAAKQGNARKAPVVKPSRKEAFVQAELEKTNTERDKEDAEAVKNAEEAVKQEAIKESEEKKALREEIDGLREHDLVEHKYFGKGEVFDNSDVNLIEVRFGNDVRFLNKDSLVKKKLLKKSNEVNKRWHV